MRRGLNTEQVEAARAALSLTPCQAAFISTAVDADLAWKLTSQVIYGDMDTARAWATDIGRPMLVIGESDFIDAVFPDGRKESIAANA